MFLSSDIIMEVFSGSLRYTSRRTGQNTEFLITKNDKHRCQCLKLSNALLNQSSKNIRSAYIISSYTLYRALLCLICWLRIASACEFKGTYLPIKNGQIFPFLVL